MLKKMVSAAIATVLISATVHAEGNIDPLLKIMSGKHTAQAKDMKALGAVSAGNDVMVKALIKAKDGGIDEAKALIAEVGGEIRTVIRNIMTVSIPLSALDKLGSSDAIVNIEASKPMRAKMNFARSVTGVDDVQDGTCPSCTQDYTGSGVLVGVVDSGIDCQHADFFDAAGDHRIVAYYDQDLEKEYTGSQLAIGGTCSNSKDTDDHGTHVAGIAAGDDITYTGVASDANIVFVKHRAESDGQSSGTMSVDILEAVDYIFQKADALDKAAVINLSLGTSLGAHDGTSLLEEGLDNAILNASGTAEKAGRVIINAAGNENYSTLDDADFGGIHATIDVSAGSNKGFEFYFRKPTTLHDGTIDFWLNSESSCKARLAAFRTSGASLGLDTGEVSFGASKSVNNGTVAVELVFDETAASGKKHGSAVIGCVSGAGCSSALSYYYFHFILSGTCTGHAWLYYDKTSLLAFTKDQQAASSGYTYAAGDSYYTTTIPGTAASVITVGSFMGRPSWLDMNGVTRYQTSEGTCGGLGGTSGDISLFSSIGPTAAVGVTKPDIAAPGEPIISTLSSEAADPPAYCYRGDLTHFKGQGTSMAAPHVAGTVALMLEKNNCLTASEVKAYIKDTANKDAYTGLSPNPNVWGAGKLDASEAMGEFDADTSCYSGTPSGSSGCGSIMPGNDRDLKWNFGIFITVVTGLLLGMRIYRRHNEN